jgi:hypothetical protein
MTSSLMRHAMPVSIRRQPESRSSAACWGRRATRSRFARRCRSCQAFCVYEDESYESAWSMERYSSLERARSPRRSHVLARRAAWGRRTPRPWPSFGDELSGGGRVVEFGGGTEGLDELDGELAHPVRGQVARSGCGWSARLVGWVAAWWWWWWGWGGEGGVDGLVEEVAEVAGEGGEGVGVVAGGGE